MRKRITVLAAVVVLAAATGVWAQESTGAAQKLVLDGDVAL